MSDDWNLTYEKVEPHGLCCAECKQSRARVEELEAALREIRDLDGQTVPFAAVGGVEGQLRKIARAALDTDELARQRRLGVL